MSRRERLPLPLRHRMPNAPPWFVGRERELRSFEDAVRRAPVAWVTGFGGLGKTALVLTVMERAFAEQRERVVALRVIAGESVTEVLRRAVAVLAQVRGLTVVSPADSTEDVVAQLLELAEGRGLRGRRGPAHWLLLEDLHRAPGDDAEPLALFAEHARDSRVLVTSRAQVDIAALPGQGVLLDPLPVPTLCELARRWDPLASDDRVSEWAERAAGSPWRLQQLVAGARPGLQPGELDWLSAMAPGVRRGILTLGLLQVESPHDVARALSGLEADAVENLTRRGILERSADTVRLHDVARQTVLAAAEAGELQRVSVELCSSLREATDPLLQLEGLRLALEVEPAAARRWVDENGRGWLDAGFAPRVWQIVANEAAPELAAFRLEVAVALGNSHALERVALPPAPSPRDRERWASVLLLLGRLEDARREAELLLSELDAETDGDLHRDAVRIVGRSYLQSDDPLRAWQVFSERYVGPWTALHELDRAVIAVRLDRAAEALEIAARLEVKIATAAPLDAARLRYGVAWIYYWSGKLADAGRVFDQGSASGALYEHESARRLLLRSGIEIGRANLGEAQRWIDRASVLTGRDPTTRDYFRMLHANVALDRGDLDDATSALEGLAREPDVLPTIRRGVFVLQVRSAIEAGPGEDPLPRPDTLPGDAGPFDRELAAWWALYRLHRGDPTGLSLLEPTLPPWVLAEVRVLAELLESRHCLLLGQAPAAVAAAQRARLAAQPDGHALLDLQAVRALLDAMLVSAHPEHAALAAELDDAARRAEARAALADGRWHSAIPCAPARAAAHLELLVGPNDAAGRRARALLGIATPLDAIDTIVVQAAQRALGVRVSCVLGPDAPSPGLGLDHGTYSVWTAGAVVDLSERRLLFNLLDALVSAGGGASKEQLLQTVWHEHDYHPLRHDPKLYAAVSALRQLLPATHSQLLRPEGGGYALDPGVPVRRADPIQ